MLDKRLYSAQTGTPMVAYKCKTRDGIQGEITFADTEKAWFRIGQFAKAAGVSEHTLDNFEMGDVIGKYVDVFIKLNERGYPEAKKFAPFEQGGIGEEPVTGPAAPSAPESESDEAPPF